MPTAPRPPPHPPPPPTHPQPPQVLETIKDPLQTLIQGREPEVVYAVLCNFLVLAQRYPLAFSQARLWRCAAPIGMLSASRCSLQAVCAGLPCGADSALTNVARFYKGLALAV